MKIIKIVNEVLLEISLIALWLLMLPGKSEISLKFLIFFLGAGILLYLFVKYFVKKDYARYLLVLLFLLLFPLISQAKLVISDYQISWNIVILCLSIILFTLLSWHDEIFEFPLSPFFKILLYSTAGLIVLRGMLWVILQSGYDLPFGDFTNFLKNILIYLLLAFVVFRISSKRECIFRLNLAILVCTIGALLI